jgi:ribose transport system permease protein
MTFCAVMAAVFLIYRRLPMWTGVIAAIATGALSGATAGTLVAKARQADLFSRLTSPEKS